MTKIKSMKELMDWIDHPTKEKPIVIEWFMPWFFKQCIEKNRVERAKTAIGTIIVFTMVCEKMPQKEAASLVMGNLKTYALMKNKKWADMLYKQIGI